MDPSEGNTYWKRPAEAEFPPLYESVNGKDSEHRTGICARVNRVLLPFKAYYFFFFGAIGSLFPFITLYYRHLWLSATQAGLLVGLRPIVQSLSMPVWAIIADKCRVKKIVLMVGLCGWLLTHTSILLVPPGEKPADCFDNETLKHETRKRSIDKSFITSDGARHIARDPKGSTDIIADNGGKLTQPDTEWSQVYRKSGFPNEQIKTPPHLHDSQSLQYSLSTTEKSVRNDGSNDRNISMKQSNDDIGRSMWNFRNVQVSIQTWHTFSYLFAIIFIGNFFSAPAQTMANTAMLQALAADSHKYGQQRCFGSIGWGVAAFAIGMLVSMNHDKSLTCAGLDDINYTPCFYAFGILMLIALAIALFFKFEDEGPGSKAPVQLFRGLRKELDCLTSFVLFTALLAGFNMGFIQTFLFWHLQTLGGTQKLFSIITGMNAIGEMIGFLLSVKLIERFGHLKVMSLGIFAYVVRLLVYGVVSNPWYVLTVELLKAFTSSAVWASVLSFIGLSNGSSATLQSVLHMFYWGLGYGGGGVLGGVLVEYVGARSVFLALAFISLLDMSGILLALNLNCCARRKQDMYMPVVSDEQEEQDSEEED